MDDETTAIVNGGSWYARLPPAFARHIGLMESERNGTPIQLGIRDEVNKKGQKYLAIWKQGE
jgi:hypothetical protein